MKEAIVTGAASGIGLATVQQLVAASYHVHALDINEAELLQQMACFPDTVSVHVGDVSDASLWSTVAQSLHGGLNLLVHSAFSLESKPLHQQTPEGWTRQLDVMLGSVLHSMRELHGILSHSEGSVVLVSSVHSHFGLRGHPAYAAAKGALNALGRQMAVEYGPKIRVNSVVPGPIMTPVWESVDPEIIGEAAKGTALNRLGTAVEVADVIVFLASPLASYIDGAEIVVDGGWSIKKHP
jgi:NAD(P)-dependent dehydrogenase (short-subunit alcohol dehydrogenase family)